MELNLLVALMNAILLVVVAISGIYLKKFRRKLRELIEFLELVEKSLEDEKITVKEVKRIIKQLEELITDC